MGNKSEESKEVLLHFCFIPIILIDARWFVKYKCIQALSVVFIQILYPKHILFRI